jgi:hypothetical protein
MPAVSHVRAVEIREAATSPRRLPSMAGSLAWINEESMTSPYSRLPSATSTPHNSRVWEWSACSVGGPLTCRVQLGYR